MNIMDSSQVKLTIPKKLKKLVDDKAFNLGLPTSVYIKHLIIDDVCGTNNFKSELTDYAENIIRDGLAEYKTGKLKKYKNIDKLLESLDE